MSDALLWQRQTDACTTASHVFVSERRTACGKVDDPAPDKPEGGHCVFCVALITGDDREARAVFGSGWRERLPKGVRAMSMDTVNVSGKSIKAAITDDCVILTVIDTPRLEGESLTSSLHHGVLEVKEHDSFTAAIEYLRHELVIQGGDWDRIYVINPARLRRSRDSDGKTQD
jgi:hypothetical protein